MPEWWLSRWLSRWLATTEGGRRCAGGRRCSGGGRGARRRCCLAHVALGRWGERGRRGTGQGCGGGWLTGGRCRRGVPRHRHRRMGRGLPPRRCHGRGLQFWKQGRRRWSTGRRCFGFHVLLLLRLVRLLVRLVVRDGLRRRRLSRPGPLTFRGGLPHDMLRGATSRVHGCGAGRCYFLFGRWLLRHRGSCSFGGCLADADRRCTRGGRRRDGWGMGRGCLAGRPSVLFGGALIVVRGFAAHRTFGCYSGLWNHCVQTGFDAPLLFTVGVGVVGVVPRGRWLPRGSGRWCGHGDAGFVHAERWRQVRGWRQVRQL